mgnify:CR=1 FL=1
MGGKDNGIRPNLSMGRYRRMFPNRLHRTVFIYRQPVSQRPDKFQRMELPWEGKRTAPAQETGISMFFTIEAGIPSRMAASVSRFSFS